ncbi:MAG: C40 family peptidase [Prosthecobacter sp.]|uniref:NlpC/P60 family protein n=1 Tax=Prosthecobacter sp. TaxID=1965333 RepID=UPI0025E8551A|nr:NlpC/P60 family protein [Prosthecobacter sp.]MCF7785276.1 C40 family peptidase [Prosthecobacter sp.]
MHTSLHLLLVMLVAAGTGPPLLAATTSTKGKKSSASETSAKKSASAKSETSAKKTTPAEPVNEDPTTPVMTPAAVSTISVEDIRDFDKYPKQIQSLVQSSMALTRLDLGYLYGSHEPSKGGMDCSGTIYHVLHFQGLKDVPRQSDEMCKWVDKKSHLYLTPTATSFDSEEFANLKPGDLLFWTNSLETTRKLPVTHVMIYLGKLKKSGKRVVFGSSDGRGFQGERRSGVSVFDFSLPKADSTKHFYGYGPTPGLLPVEPERPEIVAVTPPPSPAPAPMLKETTVSKETTTPKETAVLKESPAPKVVAKSKATDSAKETAALKEPPTPKVTSLTKETPASKESPAVKESPAAKEEVRKAVAVTTETPSETSTKKTVVAEAKSDASSKATTTAKPKTSTTKKRSTPVASPTRRRTPAAPPKSVFEQKVDRAVSSVRRFFQQ